MAEIITRTKFYEDPITRKDVETVLKKAVGYLPKIINYHIKNISNKALGYLGAHHYLVITIQRNGKVESAIHTFFLKTIPYNVKEQAAIIEECRAFYKETNFYKYVMPELCNSLKDESWVARSYLVKDDVLILEDLTSKNFLLRNKLMDTVEDVKSALSVFAKLHASSILTEKRLGKTFLELFPDLFQETLFSRTSNFHKWFVFSIDVMVAIAEHIGLDSTNIPKICDLAIEQISPSKTRRNVICHGDPKSYNVMFDDTRPLPKCILVDFQMVRYAPPMVDILQFFYINTRRAFKDENEEELLRHYHEVLCESLRSTDEEIELTSFTDILKEFEEMKIVGIVSGAFYSPTNLIDSKKCAELAEDGFYKLLFRDRVDLTLNHMKENSLYRDIVTEIIAELVLKSKYLLK